MRYGRRTSGQTYYLEGEHLESVESAGVLQEKYFRGSTIDELVAGYINQGGKLTPLFFQHDHVMSTVAQTKPNGGTQASLAYYAFGETQATTGTAVGRLKFTGREDDGNGYYQYRDRTYDPKIGAFISEDRLKFRAGPNFFAYVGNNPINFNDPSGQIVPIIAACAANPVCANVARAGFSGLANVAIGAGTAYLTGQDYTLKQGVIDFTVGAGLSGIASGIAAKQVANIRAAASVEQTGSIVGTAQVTGTAGHADRVMYEAMELSKANGGTTYMNRAMSTTTGVKTIPNVRPDVLNVGSDGVVDMVEVASKTDVPSVLMGRMGNAMSQLPSEMQGAMSVVESGLPSFYNPLIPAGGILSYQGIGASMNSYGGTSAAGGFLLYPNKPNTNSIQSVYSKRDICVQYYQQY